MPLLENLNVHKGVTMQNQQPPQQQGQGQQDPVLDPSLRRWVKVGWGVVAILFILSLVGLILLTTQGMVNGATIPATIVFVGVVLYFFWGIGRVPNDYRQVVLVWGLRWTIWGPGIHFMLRGLMDAPEQYAFSVRDITMDVLKTRFQAEISNTTVEVWVDATLRSTNILRILFSVAGSDTSGGGTPGHRSIIEQLAPAAIRAAIQTHLGTMPLDQVRTMRQRDLLAEIEPNVRNQLDQWGLVLSTCVVHVDERAATQAARDTQFALNQAFEAVLRIARSMAGVDPNVPLVRGSTEFEAVREAFPDALRLFVTERAFDNTQVLQVLNAQTFTALLGERLVDGRPQQTQAPQTPPQRPRQQRRQGRRFP